MNSDQEEQDSDKNSGEPDKKLHSHNVAYRIAEFGLYSIFVSGDIYEWWEGHRIIALVVAVAALGFLLVIDKGFSLRTIVRTLTGASLMAVAIYFLAPGKGPPFRIVGSTPMWGRHSNKMYKPDIFAYALRRGAFRAAGTNSGAQGSISIDLLLHVAITNTSETPRRITEYKLSVAESKGGPWTALCPINFKFTSLFWAADPQRPIHWADDDMLDNQLSTKAIGPGDTLSGWTGWICPVGSTNECRPTFLKYTVFDSRGESIEYIESNERSAPAGESHDWAAESSLKNKQPIDRDFSKEPLIEGACLSGSLN